MMIRRPRSVLTLGISTLVVATILVWICYRGEKSLDCLELKRSSAYLPNSLTNLDTNLHQVPPPHDSAVEFLRGVVLYVPESRQETYAKELRWFHKSWQLMLHHQPETWRTDVIVVLQHSIPTCHLLGCDNRTRSHRMEPDTCRCITGYNPVQRDFEDYNVVNSFASILWSETKLGQYDWIVRNDLDTFLTVGFSTLRPNNMIVGEGGYIITGNYITEHRLNRIADYLGLQTAGILNVGSTWYGPVGLVQKAASIAIEAMRYMKRYEFTTLEKSRDAGAKTWPDWHYPVLSMYGGHLAINHLATKYTIDKPQGLLDYPASFPGQVSEHPHIHAWHGFEDFSKIKFHRGEYVNISLETLDITVCKDFAMYIALVANRGH